MNCPNPVGLVIGFWLCGLAVVGQPVVSLYDTQPVALQGADFSVWIDPPATASFFETRQADRMGKFTRNQSPTLNFGSTGAVVWLRLRIRARNPDIWLLESSNHLIEDIHFWAVSSRGGVVRTEQHGLFFPPFPKRVRSNLTYFPPFGPSDRPGDTTTVYVRVKNNMPLVVPLRLVTTRQVADESHPKDVMAGILYGVLVAMILYNFCLLLIIRDRVYVFYVLYVLTSILTTDFQGYLHEFVIGPWLPAFPQYVSYVFFIMLTCVLLFARYFLNTLRHAPRLDTGIQILLYACWVPVLLRWLDWKLAMTLAMQGLIFVIAVYLLGMGVYLLSRGVKEARFYVLAWTALLLATLVFLSRVNGWLPNTLLIENAIPIGLALETVLLSFALADRINVYRRAVTEAQQQLITSIRETEQTKTRVVELELNALRNQMNPHFLFNSLNSIQRFILAKEPLTAANYLSKFARLMRHNLEQSREPTTPLQQEIDMLTTYLDLEMLRASRPFTYGIALAPDVNPYQTAIPGMIVQPFVENAIWHGLMHKSDGLGHIQISFNQLYAGQLRCTIEDNGVGRSATASQKSPHHSPHRSAGMHITSERLSLLTSNTTRNHIQITDLTDTDGNATGTRVDVDLPVTIP